MKLVEKEKNALEGEKNKAMEFLTLENDIFRHKSQLCQYYVWVHQHHLFAQESLDNIIALNFSVQSTVAQTRGEIQNFHNGGSSLLLE